MCFIFSTFKACLLELNLVSRSRIQSSLFQTVSVSTRFSMLTSLNLVSNPSIFPPINSFNFFSDSWAEKGVWSMIKFPLMRSRLSFWSALQHPCWRCWQAWRPLPWPQPRQGRTGSPQCHWQRSSSTTLHNKHVNKF